MPPFTPIIDKTAGKRFQMVRKYLDYNQSEMSKLCQISQAMVSMIEQGRREIPQTVLKTLFLKKNISPTYIVAGAGPMEFKKDERSGLMTNIRDLQAEMEVMKGNMQILSKRT